MNIRSFFVLALCASSFALVGCADPCGDLAACCNAIVADSGLEGEQLAQAQATCDAYNEADSDACQAVIDAIEIPEGAEVPPECEF